MIFKHQSKFKKYVSNRRNRSKITNKCVEIAVGFIDAFLDFPHHVSASNCHHQGGRSALEATQARSVLWLHHATTNHTGRMVIHIHPQYRSCLIASKALRPPWWWQLLAETCWGKSKNASINPTVISTHLLVILLRYYKMLGPTIKNRRNILFLFGRSKWVNVDLKSKVDIYVPSALTFSNSAFYPQRLWLSCSSQNVFCFRLKYQ
jgi:hypothetical protein